MKICTTCGYKNFLDNKFCNKCGKPIDGKIKTRRKDDISSTKNVLPLIIIISVVAISIISLIVFSQLQKGEVSGNDKLGRRLTEEQVIDYERLKPQPVTSDEVKREGFSLNEKPFVDGNYAYDERTKDFRLVCTNPCPVSESILDQEFAAIAYAVSTLRGITKSDIHEKLLPFEVHASEDIICPDIDAPAYMSSFVDSNGHERGQLCFKFDKVQYDRSNFPYSTSVHEVNHLFQCLWPKTELKQSLYGRCCYLHEQDKK